MHLEIITPEQQLFSGEVSLISLPGTKGLFEILENHAPIISTLDPGKIRIVKKDGNESVFDITGGVVEGSNNKVSVLVKGS